MRAQGLPAFLVGCVTLADLAAGRVLLRADAARVWVAGHALNVQCAFHAATGLPCPTCGLTRSIVMSLHGEFGRAWAMAPAGPVAVGGVALFAIALLVLALLQAKAAEGAIAATRVWMRRGALAYAAALGVVWLAGWGLAFHAALAGRA